MSQRPALLILLSVVTRVVISVAILAIGVGVFSWLVATRPQLEGEATANGSQRVAVFDPRPVPVQRQWTGFGTARAMDRADVPALVSAVVLEVPPTAEAGRPVKKGDLIAQLDDEEFRRQAEMAVGAIDQIDAELARLEVEAAAWQERLTLAEQDAELARSDVNRVREALDRGAAQQREIDAAVQRAIAAERVAVAAREELDKIAPRRAALQASRVSQEANRRLAELSVARSRIVAPIDGVLQEVDVEPGELVSPGRRVARVVDTSRIEVPLLLPASARPTIAVDDSVMLTDDASGCAWPAHITRIAPEDDPATRTVTVYAEPQDGQLPPGKFVRGTVVTNSRLTRQVIPRRSLRGDRLYVVNAGTVQEREIRPLFNLAGPVPELDLPDLAWVVLAEPLPEGDLVVLDGSRSLPVGAGAIAMIEGPEVRRADAQRPAPAGADDVNGERVP